AYVDTYKEVGHDAQALVRAELQPQVDDKKLTKEQADKQAAQMAAGIKWKDAAENSARSGLANAAKIDHLAAVITRIQDFLWATGGMSKTIRPEQLFDDSICKVVMKGLSTERGTLTSVADRKLTLTNGGQAVTIAVPDDAAVTIDGKPAKLG